MNFLLFDDQQAQSLRPFTFLHPAGDIRVGIFTIREKWEKWTGKPFGYKTSHPLSLKFGKTPGGKALLINGRVLPDQQLIDVILALGEGQSLVSDNGTLLALRVEDAQEDFPSSAQEEKKIYNQPLTILNHPWDIFNLNEKALQGDFSQIITEGRGREISNSNRFSEPESIFIHPTAKVEHAYLNPSGGKIYIGPGAEVMEGAMVRGSLAMCEGAVLKMGAKVYGATTLGPHCKAGGEISNVVFQGYANKGHDGFLGNAVIGEWCNLGADTNCSNLKNNYSNVKVYDYGTGTTADTGLQFCGLLMGDHSKCGINTMFNTGTITGIFCNIFGGGFPPTHIPSFSWGGSDGMVQYDPVKAFETAARMMERRHVELSEEDKQLMLEVFNATRPEKG